MGTGKVVDGLEGGKEGVLAVVLADSYSTALDPLTSMTSPLCLLPLCGRPLLDYTLETLRIGGVTEVILYLTSHPSSIRSWLKASTWSTSPTKEAISITTIVNEDCMSVGDACRDLDTKGVVRGEFILVGGACLVGGAGLSLDNSVERHKERMKRDRHCVMTSIYTKANPGHPLRQQGQEIVLGTDKKTDQVLFHQRAGSTSYNFPIELFQHDEINLLYNLGDPCVSVCHPTLLALFSDNFDLQTLDALVSEVLESDLVDSTLYMEVEEKACLGRVWSPYTLITMEQWVKERWFYPQVPDRPSSGLTGGSNTLYKGKNVTLGAGVVCGEGVVLGRGSSVGARTRLSQTTLGAGTVVGEGCTLLHCILLEGAEVGSGLELSHCLVGAGARIPEGATLGEKCILGAGVELGPVSLPSCSRVCAEQQDDWGDDGDEEDGGLGPKAFLYTEEEEEDHDEDESVASGAGGQVIKDWWGSLYEEQEEDDDSDEDSNDGSEDDQGDLEDDEDEEECEHEDVKNFRREVVESLERGGATDNLVLEINGSKHAWNITLAEVNQCVISAVVTSGLIETAASLTPTALLATALENVKKFSGLLLKYGSQAANSGVKQGYYLRGLEDLVAKESCWLEILPKLLHTLFDQDILEDVPILEWMKEEGDDKEQGIYCSDFENVFSI